MDELGFSVERWVVVRATRATVFSFFQDSERFASWWGAGSSIEARPGGAVHIRYPNGTTVSGKVLELVAPEHVVFTYGYDEPGRPIPPGGSRVTIRLEDAPDGTRVHLRHDVATAEIRDMHVQGWKHQLAQFANAAFRAQVGDPSAVVDRWFDAWGLPEAAARDTALVPLVTDDVTYGDPHGVVEGRAELLGHAAALHRFMPGVVARRDGTAVATHGQLMARWTAPGRNGATSRGTSVWEMAADGRIRRVTAFWE